MNQKSLIKSAIWQIVSAVPSGKVITYGQVARLAGHPSHARYVGSTLKALPDDSTLPWHRVVNAQGKISFPEGSAAYLEQRDRLLAEGVHFVNQKIPLKVFGVSLKS